MLVARPHRLSALQRASVRQSDLHLPPLLPAGRIPGRIESDAMAKQRKVALSNNASHRDDCSQAEAFKQRHSQLRWHAEGCGRSYRKPRPRGERYDSKTVQKEAN